MGDFDIGDKQKLALRLQRSFEFLTVEWATRLVIREWMTSADDIL